MRNGNTIHNKPFAVPFQGSYRTYEEWKRWMKKIYVNSMSMCSYRTYEEWKRSKEEQEQLRKTCSYRTYEEWKPSHSLKRIDIILSSYRTYEEWKRPRHYLSRSQTYQFLPYLWGMETVFAVDVCENTCSFLPYLWGMETVFAVDVCENTCSCSYRTYEEWKQRLRVYHWRWTLVLTVPMRNGNSYREKVYFEGLGEFLPYLWGMETIMRFMVKSVVIWVLTVPMRNGNAPAAAAGALSAYSSYRTYEEWKPAIPILITSPGHSSYRTYEEWKRFFELGLFCFFKEFLPYLWGMETQVQSLWVHLQP